MALKEQLNADLKTAMKAKDKETLKTLRMLKSAVQNEEIKAGHDLSEEEELTVLAREVKQRRDSMTEFLEAGRDDLVEPLKYEIEVVERYLPAQLSDDEIRDIVRTAIDEVGAVDKSGFGKVMGKVMPQVKGKVDGNKVNAIVKEMLQ